MRTNTTNEENKRNKENTAAEMHKDTHTQHTQDNGIVARAYREIKRLIQNNKAKKIAQREADRKAYEAEMLRRCSASIIAEAIITLGKMTDSELITEEDFQTQKNILINILRKNKRDTRDTRR